MRTVAATRYVTPLREGGSLPALIEASDEGLYVLKFRGAGQGPQALVAEVIVGEIARGLGYPMPELVLVELDPAFAVAEPDAEIQDLLRASAGTNLGIDFLPAALPFSPAAGIDPDPELAAEIVWLDTLVTNVDRTARNPNLLWWHGRLWLIDHGAALYFHHGTTPPSEHAQARFSAIDDHVLLGFASSIAQADRRLAPRLDRTLITAAVNEVPDSWLGETRREVYVDYLLARRDGLRDFAEEVDAGRA